MRESLGFYKHGNLPHLDSQLAVQFITFVLADAAPAKQLPRSRHGLSSYSDSDMWDRDNILDRSHGECLLARGSASRIVRRSIFLNDGRSHAVIAWVIMPNHVHLVIKQFSGFRLGNIMKQIKAGSAHLINKKLGRSCKVWQIGYFDRLISNPLQLRMTIDYIHNNPAKAGLPGNAAAWAMSSINTFDPAVVARQLKLPLK